MAVSSGLSCVLSATLSLVLMAGMQVFRSYLISTKLTTLLAGFLGSVVFLLLLTSISNLEMSMFGKNFQCKFSEVIICLVTAMFTAGSVHRVAVTTCFLFSISTIYFLNRISAKTYQTGLQTQTQQTAKSGNAKKKK